MSDRGAGPYHKSPGAPPVPPAHCEVFSPEIVQDPVFPLCERAAAILSADDFDPVAVMSNRQPPHHARIRRYTREGFDSGRMRVLEPFFRAYSARLIDRMLERGPPAEFVSAFAHPLPGQVIFRFIGFPEADDDELMRWTSNRLTFTWGRPSDDEQVAIAANELAPDQDDGYADRRSRCAAGDTYILKPRRCESRSCAFPVAC